MTRDWLKFPGYIAQHFVGRMTSRRGTTSYLEYFLAATAMAMAAAAFYAHWPELETHFDDIYCEQVKSIGGSDMPCVPPGI